MVYKVRRSASANSDLEAIFRHLIESYMSFGESRPDAVEKAQARVRIIRSSIEDLAFLPHQGTIGGSADQTDVRHVTKNKAIIYFQVNDMERVIHILAIFYSGQDHQRRMVERLTGPFSLDR